MKLSIITATFNPGIFLNSCLSSVSSQSYPNIEHIIIDGGSTDGTLEIIKNGNRQWAMGNGPASPLTPHPLRVISEPDNGIYDALNKGIRLATGDIIGFLHADDLYADNTVIEKVIKVMSQRNCDSCYGDLEYVRESGQESAVRGQGSEASHDSRLTTDDSLPFTPHSSRFTVVRYWKSGEYSPSLLRKGWMPPHPTFFVKREVYRKFGVFDTSFRIASDYELMLRFLGRHRISTCYIPEVLVKMRMGGTSNRSISNILRKSSEDLRAMKLHNIGGLPTLLFKNISKIPQFFKR